MPGNNDKELRRRADELTKAARDAIKLAEAHRAASGKPVDTPQMAIARPASRKVAKAGSSWRKIVMDSLKKGDKGENKRAVAKTSTRPHWLEVSPPDKQAMRPVLVVELTGQGFRLDGIEEEPQRRRLLNTLVRRAGKASADGPVRMILLTGNKGDKEKVIDFPSSDKALQHLEQITIKSAGQDPLWDGHASSREGQASLRKA